MPLLTVGHRTDVGLRRSLNEDATLVGRRIFAVADGMGGHAAGDVASAIVVARLRDLEAKEFVRPAEVIGTIDQANADVLNYAQAHPDAWGLGSTVSGLVEVRVGDALHWAIFNVGDSRVYRFWGEELSRATVDHSEAEELIAEGRITEEEARTHHLRNVITRSVGIQPAPMVDLWVLPQTPGERFLICSDGLSSELNDEEIAQVLREHSEPQAAADALVQKVLGTAARDNVSVIIVDVSGAAAEFYNEETNPRLQVWQGGA